MVLQTHTHNCIACCFVVKAWVCPSPSLALWLWHMQSQPFDRAVAKLLCAMSLTCASFCACCCCCAISVKHPPAGDSMQQCCSLAGNILHTGMARWGRAGQASRQAGRGVRGGTGRTEYVAFKQAQITKKGVREGKEGVQTEGRTS